MSGKEGMERVPVREFWPLEANFTSWLADHMKLLSRTVGIDLEFIQEEAPLPGWGGRVDILARVAGTDEYVVIENQMETSDNDHLAGLLNYASQSGSKVLVWVAGEFADWHRRTLDWLNEREGMRIFGVEMSARRTGEHTEGSLKLVAGPTVRSEWQGYEYPADKQRYLDFFWPVAEELREREIARRRVPRASNDQVYPSGYSGIEYHAGFWHSFGGRPSLDVYLWISTPERERNKEIFDALYRYRDEIECELPGVSWDRRDNQRMCSIYFIKRGAITDSPELLAELQAWVLDKLPKLKAVFQPHLETVMWKMTSGEDS